MPELSKEMDAIKKENCEPMFQCKNVSGVKLGKEKEVRTLSGGGG